MELQLSNSPSNEYSGLISFRIDWFDLLQSKGLRDFTEDYSLGNSLSIALRKLSPGGRGRSHYIYDFWLGNTFNQAHISVKITVSHKDR